MKRHLRYWPILTLTLLISCQSSESDDHGFKPGSNSYILISIEEALPDTIYAEATAPTILPFGGNVSPTVPLFSQGKYFLNLIVDRPNAALLTMGGSRYQVFISPEDTTKLVFKNNGDPIFYGHWAEINDYYLAKKRELGYSNIGFPLNKDLTSKSTYNSLKQSTDLIIDNELNFLNTYPLQNTLPKWFLDHERYDIIYTGAGFKTTLPHYNDFFSSFEDSLPVDYFDYLKGIEINNPKAKLSGTYFYFLDDYFIRDLPLSEFNDLTGYARIRRINTHIKDKIPHELSGEILELYSKHLFSFELLFHSDSLEIDSLAKAYDITNYAQLVKASAHLGKRTKTNDVKPLSLAKGDTIPEFLLTNLLDSVISVRQHSDKILYVNFWATWCGPCIKNFPELNKLIEEYDQDENIEFVNICLESPKDRWKAYVGRYKLRGINFIAEGNWNTSIRSAFNIKGIPHYAILSKGNVMFENHTAKAPEVKDKIDQLIKTGGTK